VKAADAVRDRQSKISPLGEAVKNGVAGIAPGANRDYAGGKVVIHAH